MHNWNTRGNKQEKCKKLIIKFWSYCFQRHSMDSLIELLQTSNMEPSERKTSFLQLNILTQDPELTEIFHNANGLYLCMDALQNALKVSFLSFFACLTNRNKTTRLVFREN